MTFITPKINWVSSDCLLCEDLNRVENNTKYLAEKLRDNSYPVPLMSHKTTWVNEDIIYAEDLNRIEANIKTVCKSFFINKEFEELKTNWKTLDPVSFDFANRIEKDLTITNNLINYMQSVFIFSGVANCGQNGLWQQKFRRYGG